MGKTSRSEKATVAKRARARKLTPDEKIIRTLRFPNCIGRFPECESYTSDMEINERDECKTCPFLK